MASYISILGDRYVILVYELVISVSMVTKPVCVWTCGLYSIQLRSLRMSLLTAGPVATQLQRTDTKLLFIPVIFIILRIWDVVANTMHLYASVNTPYGVSFTIRLLAVSNVLS